MELEDLEAEVFENLVFDLVCDCGLINPQWRTPGSDEGRDIQGEFYISDLSGYYQRQLWYIECKKYSGSINWPLIWEKISYAEAHNADILLVANTSTITPQARNQVTKWNESGKRPTIRVWNKVDIQERLNIRKYISIKYGLSSPNLQGVIDPITPLIKLLIKTNNSLYSSGIESKGTTVKLELSHALGELLDKRVDDIEMSGKILWSKIKSTDDLYEWIHIDDIQKISIFDTYAFRALCCYLRMCFSTELIQVNSLEDLILIPLPRRLEAYQIDHLRVISMWSNFQILTNDSQLNIKGVQVETRNQ
ncbi:restriction endonuclease [Pseudomonas aeruginosa]|uniref:restriction endonuclease n=1 Tax=Pseudomonas aeruginosa TaxID=287 RepID=UPI000B4C8EDE|nr:restriction endonuclease [Pseudomonas aeruginosa]ASD16298.1 hypothetical protein CD799_10495 [Pseudomonas aeruginosa]MBG4511254.1 restriction endonuclease [Pseudomonas aeruginosa]MBX5741931.1 restriction endonuclease [Pseudomonas aeruginosa]MBX6056595.1 restriction endonuclease [Pseudomonas aeruginosa]MBX6081903.1 restriction endonuclease [Pseudomonas aeruginosa]